MAVILDFYKENKSNSKEIKSAEEYLLIDTLSKNIKGYDKIKEIDGMDMESKLSGNIIPSMIYTFIYDTGKDMQNENNIVFGDKMPIVLCSNVKPYTKLIDGKLVKGMYIFGINLNFLLPEERALLLDSIYNSFLDFYDNIYKDVYENKTSINKGLLTILRDTNFVKNLYAISKIDVSKCVRCYNINFAKNIRLIEYNLWKYIPLYEAKQTVTKATIQEIQKIMSIK